jgi:ferredoxin, 2Fe-2S
MAKVTYIDADGIERVVEVEAGFSVMEGAVRNAVPGIVAECGGNCACGTCRVYVDQVWQSVVGEPSDIEEATLDVREDARAGKRLSCQIIVTPELDGLVVRTPASQYA